MLDKHSSMNYIFDTFIGHIYSLWVFFMNTLNALYIPNFRNPSYLNFRFPHIFPGPLQMSLWKERVYSNVKSFQYDHSLYVKKLILNVFYSYYYYFIIKIKKFPRVSFSIIRAHFSKFIFWKLSFPSNNVFFQYLAFILKALVMCWC